MGSVSLTAYALAQAVMLHRINIVLLATLALGLSLPVFAATETEFLAIFEKYNDARMSAEIETLTGVLVKVEAEAVKACIESDICGRHFVKNLKAGALKTYRITSFVEFDQAGHIVRQRGNRGATDHAGGPAVQIYYEGEDMRGVMGRGVATFLFEDGEWRISMVSWEKRQ